MRNIKSALLGVIVGAAILTSGCGGGGSSAQPGGQATTAAAATSAASAKAESSAAADDTKAACATVNGDVQSTLAKVADAEKIGPPAGYNAVSAQYSAGAAVLYSHAFNTSAQVNDAAKKVADAMGAIADEWAKNPQQKPSTAGLDAALDQLKAVCGAA
ncbi:hypothetical protein [Dactylosporangium matsuzakiense]|uniref:Lipoprotein n=1 Tax=Dactylosporangium matsuzakiense TaxID=53360 RepID=A0A9W6KRS2_9ACTN|nr:hypothetical protein [Dactylosporangium matsuzakiense]UWZ48367.1 hypothetical protein Dmats_19330 [Dactylosporangium matsuzakiense]GLL05479.1 hypothetical protein GCM10017581_072260 [Dactylosporangium matsuzakiense]